MVVSAEFTAFPNLAATVAIINRIIRLGKHHQTNGSDHSPSQRQTSKIARLPGLESLLEVKKRKFENGL